MTKIVTRFAPSPTGHLHIGGARTAIFNWLLARGAGGAFYLRIEDTDQARSTEENTRGILDSMAWLGLSHDGEPVYQSQRFDLYNRSIDRLLESGHAYFCSCTPDEVEAMREAARARGAKPKYSGHCREKGLRPGPGAPEMVVRLKAPLSGTTVVRDLVKGDDHLNNTPRQILIYQALGLPLPAFGHVPMILGPDKKKLSKRHGATSVMEYEREGFLPEAMLNGLVRLGWSHGDQEIFSRDELLQAFSTENLGASAAVFDRDKMLWLNAHYIKETPDAALAVMLGDFLGRLGRDGSDTAYLEKVVPLLKPRAQTLVEMAEKAAFFVMPDAELAHDQKAVEKFFTSEAKGHLAALWELLKTVEPFDQPSLEAAVQGYLDATGVKFKLLAQPIRVAITGTTASPGLFETMEALGRTRVLSRLERALSL